MVMIFVHENLFNRECQILGKTDRSVASQNSYYEAITRFHGSSLTNPRPQGQTVSRPDHYYHISPTPCGKGGGGVAKRKGVGGGGGV